MARCSIPSGRAGPRSLGSPIAPSSRPSTASPTGVRIGVPRARAAVPRRKPAVPPSATARTIAGPRCCCTSATSGGPRSHSIATASLIAGSIPPAKERSTTEPWTAATRPGVGANTSGSTEADIVFISNASFFTDALIQLKAVADAHVRMMCHAYCRKEFRSERRTSMFLTAYVALVIFAALPLARTLLTGRSGRSGVIFLHRLYRDLAYIAAAHRYAGEPAPPYSLSRGFVHSPSRDVRHLSHDRPHDFLQS